MSLKGAGKEQPGQPRMMLIIGAVPLQVLPYLRALASTASYAWLKPMLPRQWSYYYNGQVIEQKQPSAHGGEELASMLAATSLTAGRDAGVTDTAAMMESDPIEDD
jgi:hypothetical protein